MLRGLVPDLETAARAVPEARRAEVFELMAATYQACSAALAKLGEPEAAWIAADRAMAAAERAGNPRRPARMLGAAAVVTSRLKLGTGACIVA